MRNRQWKHGPTASGSNFSSPDIAHGRPDSTSGSPGIMDGRPHFAHGRLGSTDGVSGSGAGVMEALAGVLIWRVSVRNRVKAALVGPSPAPRSAAALQARRNGLAPPLQKLLSTAAPLAGFPKDVLRLPVTLPMGGTSCLAGLSPGSVAKSSFPPRLSGAVMAEQSIDCLFFNFPNGPSHPQ